MNHNSQGLPTHTLTAFLILASGTALLLAQKATSEDAPVKLRVRRHVEEKFTSDTRNVSVEVVRDRKARRRVYIADDGKSLAAVGVDREKGKWTDKAVTWVRRLKLPMRKWDEKGFREDGPTVSVEVYHDASAGVLLYVSHTGQLAAIRAVDSAKEGKAKPPRWCGRLRLRARPSGEDSGKPLRQCNVEVYRDVSAGCLLYVGDNGALAAVSAATVPGVDDATRPEKLELPKPTHGLVLKARRFGEEKFTAKTGRIAYEAYRDGDHNNWVYVSETLHLAAVAAEKETDLKRIKEATWQRSLLPDSASKGRWCVEVAHNPNSKHSLYFTSYGSLAVTPE